MLLYVLICLSLALTGVAGLQMMYMFYLESVDRERKKYLVELEHECKRLRLDLINAEKAIAEQKLRPESIGAETVEEAWADVIEER
jgi:hypothetical protein